MPAQTAPPAGQGPVPRSPAPPAGRDPVRAVQPTAEPHRGPAVRVRDEPDEPPPQAGDLVCGQCGAGNVPTRRFCRRCGSSLQDARVAPRPPWWKRLFTRRPKAAPVAGERPRQRRWRRPSCLLPLALLVVLAGAGYALRGQVPGAVESVRDRIGKAEQVHAVRLTASSSGAGHAAALAVDGTTDKYWAPAATGDAHGQFLEVEFPGPVRLLDVVVHPGISPVAEKFLTQARPAALLVTVTAEDGRVTRKTVRVPDEPGPHRFRVPVSDAVRVRVTIESAAGAAPGRHVAVAELEFFKRA
ncbi:discoidin domain-containing protein [Streptomyces sp. NRRL S-87]|uniref:discoidin domain-containing protein n=1 Tax=Streptomyces sp. NRRL S-87 TaxID=1463920 RepID=UPI000690BBAB|nr:discoidin domain-containing protein [Streptomyces sp. NRRL S-87]